MSNNNILTGAVMAVAQVSTLGQPFEVLKTHLAANRHDSFGKAVRHIWSRGGFVGFYQGLVPWGWLEASTKGAILLYSANRAEQMVLSILPGRSAVAGSVGGLVGGAMQAYAIMGLTTTMKTVEITRQKAATTGQSNLTTMQICRSIYAKEGIRGLNKGVNAVAIRQMTTWASRMGITRFVEGSIRTIRGKTPDARLSAGEKVLASCCGGALSCWNQPFEVIRIEMQKAVPSDSLTSKPRLNMWSTASHIFRTDGALAFFRGITPRMMLAASVTTFMVAGGDWMKGSLAQ